LSNQLRAKLAGSLDDFLKSLAEPRQNAAALAIDLAHELGRTDQEKMEWVKNVMQQWADTDPQKAWQWLTQQSFKRGNELAEANCRVWFSGRWRRAIPTWCSPNIDTLLRQGNLSEAVSTSVALQVGMQALVDHGNLDLARSAVETWARDPRKFELGEAAISTVAWRWRKKLRPRPVNGSKRCRRRRSQCGEMSSLATRVGRTRTACGAEMGRDVESN